MAVTKVTENYQERTASDTADGKTTLRVFFVDFDTDDDPLERPLLACKAQDPHTKLSIPPRGRQHPFRRNMYVKSIFAEPLEGPFCFKVTCTYSTISSTGGQNTENPLKEKPDISWTFNTSNERIDRDISGNAITNSAGQSFDPPISKDFHDLVLKYIRNEKNFDPAEAKKYKGHVNSDTFLKWPPKTVLCTIFDGDKIYNEEFGDYYKVTYEFQFRLDEVKGKQYGWQRRILDEGLYEKDGNNNDGTPKLVAIKDDDGQPVTAPVPLDGSGGKKRADAEDVFLTFEIYPEVSFGSLNITV